MNPRLPESRAAATRRQQNSGTWLALAMVVAVGSGFIGLVWMVMPAVGQMVLVAASFPAFIAIHYFTWGRRLTLAVRQGDAKEPRENSDHRIGGTGTE